MHGKILVTGGTGLLGSALQKQCPDAVYVGSKDYDLRRFDEAERMFGEIKPTRVIHLAANVGGVKKNAEQNATLFSDNVLINTNVIEAAIQGGVKRLISILSSCCFKIYPDKPSTESDLHEGAPFAGNLGYGYAKRMLDIHSRLAWEQHRLQFSSITPATMYGLNDNWDLESGHVVAALIRRTFIAKERGEPLTVWGSGNAVRQFVLADDVARLLLEEIDTFDGPDNMIVAPDSGVSIRDLTSMIAELMNFKGEIIFDQSKPEGQLKRVLISEKFKKRYPEFSFTPLRSGLKMTIDWFLKNYKTARVLKV